MLAVQVQYWTLQEAKRHNLEQETNWRDTLAETKRHNVAQEGYWNAQIELGYAQLAETSRHNYVEEDIGYINASANVTKAQASLISAGAAASQAATASAQYSLNQVLGMKSIEYQSKEFSLKQNQFQFQKKIDIANTAIKGFNAGISAIGTLTGAAKTAVSLGY